MTPRWLVVWSLAAALLAGCGSTAPRWSTAPAPDPGRWERAACRLGAYPPELDARALARARQEDLRSRRTGDWSTFEAARLESERAAFDARCAKLGGPGLTPRI